MTNTLQIIVLSIILVQTSLTTKKCECKAEVSGTTATTNAGLATAGDGSHHRDAAASQLLDFLKSKPSPERMTTSWGAPVSTKTAVLTAGQRGPMLMQDTVFMDELSHFDRERIPERVAHAKGAGAFGFFEVTNDITQYSKAFIFSKIGKRTPCFVRFSTVFGSKGSPDTVFEHRGFAQKYYTEDGNWDLTGINQPIFPIRDPILAPSITHIAQRNPVTNLLDPTAFWDFLTQLPESLFFLMRIFSDLGTPDGYRKMDGFGTNTFKLVNKNGTAVFCKFHLKTVQGLHNLTAQQAHQLKADDPDYGTRDLYNAIANGDFPKWEMKIQVMTFKQAEKYRWNPFDPTKMWHENEFPLIPVGRLTLNKNPTNFFEQVEQAAFSPGRMIPGIEASPDKVLQGRLFAYPDTQNHRLGPNFIKLPINCPFRVNNTQIDGAMRFDGNEGGAPIYHPNMFNGPVITGKPDSSWSIEKAIVERFETGDEANYDHPAIFWNSELDEGGRERLVANIAVSLRPVTVPRIQILAVDEFSKINCRFGRMLAEALGISTSNIRQCSPTTTTPL